MNLTIAANEVLTDPRFRFTIRQIGRGDLRKRMIASRFLAKRGEYAGRTGIRVDVLDTENGTVQTWDLQMTKIYWA